MEDYQTPPGHCGIYGATNPVWPVQPHLPEFFAKWPNVWQTDLMRTEGFEQFRNSQKPRLHLFWESQEFALHQSACDFNRPICHTIAIAFLR